MSSMKILYCMSNWVAQLTNILFINSEGIKTGQEAVAGLASAVHLQVS
jgi:hypothetical protein